MVYSIGVERESSFEAELLERFPNITIYGYDLSVDDVRQPLPLQFEKLTTRDSGDFRSSRTPTFMNEHSLGSLVSRARMSPR